MCARHCRRQVIPGNRQIKTKLQNTDGDMRTIPMAELYNMLVDLK